MKKILVIFRGMNVRHRRPEHPGMGTPYFKSKGEMHYINPLLGLNNWRKAIFEDLTSKGIQYDVAFVTYPSEVLDDLVKELNPKYLITEGYDSQNGNMKAVTSLMEEVADQYDRFVILRFDFEYRIRITEWPEWSSKGITLVNRDVTWDTSRLYADIMFVVDSQWLKEWRGGVDVMGSFPHDIGKYLWDNKIPLNLMYEGYFNMVDHPLHSYISWEESPDLDKPFTPIHIK